eukprot:Skav222126  [mRNA]  locus=scaffold1181:587037:587743:+ [translate_table: standard]
MTGVNRLFGSLLHLKGLRLWALDLHLVTLCRTNRFHWQGTKLVLAMSKGAVKALTAVALGIELKAQLGLMQTRGPSQFLQRVRKITVVTHAATLGTPVLAYLGEFQGVSSLLGGHHRRRRPMDQM